MPRPPFAWIPLLMTCTASLADNCESVSAQIEAKIRAAGVASFGLSSVPMDESVPGKVVGTCALGTKKIVYSAAGKAAAAASAPAATAAATQRKVKRPTKSSEMITECKDGSMSLGGECKN
jgi:Protein of unknown function (DUF1161)